MHRRLGPWFKKKIIGGFSLILATNSFAAPTTPVECLAEILRAGTTQASPQPWSEERLAPMREAARQGRALLAGFEVRESIATEKTFVVPISGGEALQPPADRQEAQALADSLRLLEDLVSSLEHPASNSLRRESVGRDEVADLLSSLREQGDRFAPSPTRWVFLILGAGMGGFTGGGFAADYYLENYLGLTPGASTPAVIGTALLGAAGGIALTVLRGEAHARAHENTVEGLRFLKSSIDRSADAPPSSLYLGALSRRGKLVHLLLENPLDSGEPRLTYVERSARNSPVRGAPKVSLVRRFLIGNAAAAMVLAVFRPSIELALRDRDQRSFYAERESTAVRLLDEPQRETAIVAALHSALVEPEIAAESIYGTLTRNRRLAPNDLPTEVPLDSFADFRDFLNGRRGKLGVVQHWLRTYGEALDWRNQQVEALLTAALFPDGLPIDSEKTPKQWREWITERIRDEASLETAHRALDQTVDTLATSDQVGDSLLTPGLLSIIRRTPGARMQFVKLIGEWVEASAPIRSLVNAGNLRSLIAPWLRTPFPADASQNSASWTKTREDLENLLGEILWREAQKLMEQGAPSTTLGELLELRFGIPEDAFN